MKVIIFYRKSFNKDPVTHLIFSVTNSVVGHVIFTATKVMKDMKRAMFAIAMAIVAGGLFSCKSEYTCKCEKIYYDSTQTVTYNDGSYILKDNRARAEDRCNAQESTGTDLRGNYSRQCRIDD